MNWKVYQVYYDNNSLHNCYDYPNIERYPNKELTPYFENSIFLELGHESVFYDYFGVWSHLHKQKVQGRGFDINRLEERLTVDVLAFQRFLRNGRIFSGDQEKMYGKIFNKLMESLKLKYRFPNVPKFVVMQNHFIARGWIFNNYVDTVLRPAIKLLDTLPEASQEVIYHGKAPRYTYKPFICEKLFSAYLYEKNFNCQHW